MIVCIDRVVLFCYYVFDYIVQNVQNRFNYYCGNTRLYRSVFAEDE